jgi:hypothetical protein
MKRLSKRTWRGIHSLSALLVWCAVVHGALAGTDAANVVVQAVSWLLIAVSVSAGLTRVFLGRGGQRLNPTRSAAKSDRTQRLTAATRQTS